MIGGVFFYLINNSTVPSQGNKSKYGFIAFTIIYLFAIFRYNIGDDYGRYWDMVSTGELLRPNFEPLSGAIINYVYKLHFPPLLFFIFSTLSLVCYYFVISKYSSNRVLSLYFYFTFPLLFFQDCSTIRQSGAMAFFVLTFFFVDNKKSLKALFCVVLAYMMQRSGIIAIVLFMIPLFAKVSLKWNVILFIFSFFLGMTARTLLESYLGNLEIAAQVLDYVNRDMGGFNTFQYVLYGINVLNFLSYKQLCKISSRNALYITLVNLGMVLYNIFMFESQTATRIVAFFLLFEMILIPDYRFVLKRITGSVKSSTALIFSVMLALQIMIVVIYIKAYNGRVLDTPVYTPYETWLNHIK